MPTPAPTSAAPAAVAPSTPSPTPAPAAPAAPATPTPSTPPPPATPPAAPAGDEKAKDRGTRIWKLLQDDSAEPPGKKPETPKPADPAPAAPAAPAAAAAPTDPTAPAPDDKTIKAPKKRPIDKRPEPPTAAAPAAPAAVTAPAAAPANDDEWESSLIPEEKQLLDDAAEAESHLPGRKGLKEQVKKFVKEHQKYLADHPELDGDKEDPATQEAETKYERWLKKARPSLTESEQREVSEKRIAARVAQPLEQKTQQLEHELFVRDEEPKIVQRGEQVRSELNTNAMPAEIVEFAQKHGVDVARQEFADELKIHNRVVNMASACYQELIRLGTINPKNGKALASLEVDPAKDPARAEIHELLGKIIPGVCDEFKETATKTDLVRDGKWFVTREEWNNGYSKFPGQYWTFTNKEIAERSLRGVPAAIQRGIEAHREEMKSRGWERRKFTPGPAVPPAVPATPLSSAPGPGASPVPPATAAQPAPVTPGSRIAAALTNG